MVKPKPTVYIPDRGDVVWLQFTPQTGHEQAGHRPALVISPKEYNGLVGLALMCPITSKIKGYPFEVKIAISSKPKLSGVVLSDQVKNLDWRAREAIFICRAPSEITEDVRAKLQTLL